MTAKKKTPAQRTYYNKFSRFLKDYYGSRIQKITINAGFTCPNRDGTLSTGGCIYCDNSAFNVNVRRAPASIKEQIQSGIHHGTERNISKFMAYFQPFSNTYDMVANLKICYDTIYGFDEIVALAIGTRPDCVDKEKISLINSYTKQYMVWIEYGLQSIHDKTLSSINRGHTKADFLQTIAMTHQFPNIYICVHVILGLPGENHADMMAIADCLATLPIHGLKLHPLHIVHNTALAEMYAQGHYTPLTFDQYITAACDFLERIPPHVTIQRITADAPPAILIAPTWVSRKMATLNAIDNEFKRRGTSQGSALIHK